MNGTTFAARGLQLAQPPGCESCMQEHAKVWIELC